MRVNFELGRATKTRRRNHTQIMQGFFEELFPTNGDGTRKFVIETSFDTPSIIKMSAGVLAAGLLIKKL